MQTIILCGGEGTRLMPRTHYRPKPMIKIGGKPILWHIMKIYTHFGHNDFLLAAGYKYDVIQDFVSQNTGDGFNIKVIDTGLKSLTGERVRRLKKYITGPRFMVTYGDGVADIDINELVKYHKSKSVLGTITGVHPRHRFGLIKTDNKNRVVWFQQKPVLSDIVNGGFMVFERTALDHLRRGSTIEDLFQPLIEQNQLALYHHPKFWFAVDTYRDLLDAEKFWREGAPWKVWSDK